LTAGTLNAKTPDLINCAGTSSSRSPPQVRCAVRDGRRRRSHVSRGAGVRSTTPGRSSRTLAAAWKWFSGSGRWAGRLPVHRHKSQDDAGLFGRRRVRPPRLRRIADQRWPVRTSC
jgi:hypothetical protein